MSKDTDTVAADNGLRDHVKALLLSPRGRNGMLALDLATVALFLALSFLPPQPWVVAVDAVLGTVLLGEFLTRLWISDDRWQFLSRPFSIIDVVVIATLLLPTLVGNLGFLRILRAVRLIRSLRVLQELRRRGGFFARHGELIASVTNLLLFIFITSAVVYVLQADVNPGIGDFTDAVYFTVSALTTTGFGDITLVGEHGSLLSVVIMLVGISLFLKVAQAIFRPLKVHVECPVCGLSRHDPDAVHCKHCGNVIHIETEGA